VVSAQTTPYLIRSLSPNFTNTNTNTQSITTSPVCTLFAWFFGLLVSALLLETYLLDQYEKSTKRDKQNREVFLLVIQHCGAACRD
jgi:hypothetical protein